MKLTQTILCGTALALSSIGVVWGQSCESNNLAYDENWTASWTGSTQHSSGVHTLYNYASGTCRFTRGPKDPNNPPAYFCLDNDQLSPGPSWGDSGSVYHLLQPPHYNATHKGYVTANNGSAYGVGPVIAHSNSAEVTLECLPGDNGCYATNLFLAGTSLTYQWYAGSGPGSVVWQFSNGGLSYACPQLDGYYDATPILVPTKEKNDDGTPVDCSKELTEGDDGVLFRFFPENSEPVRIQWTKPGANCGWLAIRDRFGRVSTGADLMGNLTWQPVSPLGESIFSYPTDGTPYKGNGWNALSKWNEPKQSGDGDREGVEHKGQITSADGIWSATAPDGRSLLGVWVDRHQGQFTVEDWYSLPQIGVTAIDLAYRGQGQDGGYPLCGHMTQNGHDVKICDWKLAYRPQ